MAAAAHVSPVRTTPNHPPTLTGTRHTVLWSESIASSAAFKKRPMALVAPHAPNHSLEEGAEIERQSLSWYAHARPDYFYCGFLVVLESDSRISVY